jgi:hypothetical protein
MLAILRFNTASREIVQFASGNLRRENLADLRLACPTIDRGVGLQDFGDEDCAAIGVRLLDVELEPT